LLAKSVIYDIFRLPKVSLKLPIAAYADRDAFKIYMLDTGLLAAASKLDITTFYDPNPLVYKEFKGAITEQFVLQELKTLGGMQGMPIYYWGREEGKSEVDFVVQWRNEIVPIEVKSGIRTQSKSLDIYRELYHPAHSVRTTLKGFGVNGDLHSIPIYMIASFADMLAK
jgi:predicted AAA+ superfamily ATPase